MTVSIGNIRFIESIPAKGVSWIIKKGARTNLIKPNCRLHIITLLCKVVAVVLHIINHLGTLEYCFYARRVRNGEGEPPPLGDEGIDERGVVPIVPYKFNELGMPG
jgi:hypothetical protein